MSILFDQIAFGPIQSRRFGLSLGVNLLPLNQKYCNYDCIYCECGLTEKAEREKISLFTPEEIRKALEKRLKELQEQGISPDSITFAGNGEPSMHPRFPEIIDDTLRLRDRYFPKAKVTVLSNATMLQKDVVKQALQKVDNNILKLDAGSNEMYQKINRPLGKVTIDEIVSRLMEFQGNLTVQTLFLRGEVDGEIIDNTTDPEVSVWLGHLNRIRPHTVMLYPIERETPFSTLQKISETELSKIAQQVEKLGIEAKVYS